MKNKLLRVFQLFAVACLLSSLSAQAQDSIGRVIRTEGVVSAVDTSGAERPLARGSELFVDEAVVTGRNGSTQLRLSDGGLITMNEDTYFVVNEYIYDGAGGSDDSVVMSVVQGALRTITGVIGEADRDTYALITPMATIGIRGTEFGVFVDPATGLTRIAVFDGSITVQPGAGGPTTIVGLDGNTDFVLLEDDATVVEVPAATPDIEALINTIVAAVTAADLESLPNPADAVRIQRQQNANDSAATPPGSTGAGGTLTDAVGNALAAGTEEERRAALIRLIESIIAVDPTFFDDTTITSVSPN